MAAEAPSEDPSEVVDGEEAGMQHPRTAVVATTALVGAAASPAASRTAEAAQGRWRKAKRPSERPLQRPALASLVGCRNSRPQPWMQAPFQFDKCSIGFFFSFLKLIVISKIENFLYLAIVMYHNLLS